MEIIFNITVAVVSLYCLIRIVPSVFFFMRERLWGIKPKKKNKKDIAEINEILILLITTLTMWVAYITYKDSAELNEKNKVFLDSANSIIESSKVINQQSVEFQKESIESLKAINNQAQSILGAAEEMSKRSNEFLIASKDSLETFRNASNDLKGIIQNNIDLSNRQVSIMNENFRKQVELLNRKAEMAIFYNQMDLSKRRMDEAAPLEVDAQKEWTKLVFVFGNSGLVPLEDPVIVFTTSPDKVCVKDGGGEEGCGFRQFSGLNIIKSLNPGTHSNLPIEVKVPENLDGFGINVSISGKGMESPLNVFISYKVHRINLPPTPTPARKQ